MGPPLATAHLLLLVYPFAPEERLSGDGLAQGWAGTWSCRPHDTMSVTGCEFACVVPTSCQSPGSAMSGTVALSLWLF